MTEGCLGGSRKSYGLLDFHLERGIILTLSILKKNDVKEKKLHLITFRVVLTQKSLGKKTLTKIW